MHDQNDPSQVYALVVFESEEKARVRENDPRRKEKLQAVRAIQEDIYGGPPQFTNLTVADEWTARTASSEYLPGRSLSSLVGVCRAKNAVRTEPR